MLDKKDSLGSLSKIKNTTDLNVLLTKLGKGEKSDYGRTRNVRSGFPDFFIVIYFYLLRICSIKNPLYSQIFHQLGFKKVHFHDRCIFHFLVYPLIREGPLITSNFRVHSGVQNGPKKLDVLGLKRIGRKVKNLRKLSEVINGRSLRLMDKKWL